MPVNTKSRKDPLTNQIRSLIYNILYKVLCSKWFLVGLTVGSKYLYQIQSPNECEKLHSDRGVRKNDR